MKTADLIPFILLELEESDKYGFELTKNIETKSNGNIIIKQPTLYTLLKKLEKSKFISSYWQDSEIGGKRHYYKLTESGRLHVSTLPSYETLMQNALNDEFEYTVTQTPSTHAFVVPQEEKRLSIMDELLLKNTQTSESILPSEEVFANENIDSSTGLDINLTNAEILKEKEISLDEQFATNKQVSTFTEKIPVVSTSIPSKNEKPKSDEVLNTEFIAPHNDMEIKHVDYVDFKNCKENQYAKKVVKKKLLQVLATSGTLIILLALCELLTNFAGHSTLYYVFFISSILIAIFYPVIYASNMEKYRLKYQKDTYKAKIKNRIFIGLTIMLVVLVISIITSIKLDKNSLSTMFGFNNFANLYAPILLSLIYFIDLLYCSILTKKINK